MSGKPRLLDLFCGAGGAAMGYHRAGFDVVGVDIKPQPHYPFEFHQADALTYPLDGFDVIHASPPCQLFTVAGNIHRSNGKEYSDFLTPTIQRLQDHGGIWVIENVMSAPMGGALVLCGLMFGLKVLRHRKFKLSHLIFQPGHPSHNGHRIGFGYYSVAGCGGAIKGGGQKTVENSTKKWAGAMGIDWMTKKELTQAIPPAYTEFIGRQLMKVWLESEAKRRGF